MFNEYIEDDLNHFAGMHGRDAKHRNSLWLKMAYEYFRQPSRDLYGASYSPRLLERSFHMCVSVFS